jgi:hypothetical protein
VSLLRLSGLLFFFLETTAFRLAVPLPLSSHVVDWLGRPALAWTYRVMDINIMKRARPERPGWSHAHTQRLPLEPRGGVLNRLSSDRDAPIAPAVMVDLARWIWITFRDVHVVGCDRLAVRGIYHPVIDFVMRAKTNSGKCPSLVSIYSVRLGWATRKEILIWSATVPNTVLLQC